MSVGRGVALGSAVAVAVGSGVSLGAVVADGASVSVGAVVAVGARVAGWLVAVGAGTAACGPQAVAIKVRATKTRIKDIRFLRIIASFPILDWRCEYRILNHIISKIGKQNGWIKASEFAEQAL